MACSSAAVKQNKWRSSACCARRFIPCCKRCWPQFPAPASPPLLRQTQDVANHRLSLQHHVRHSSLDISACIQCMCICTYHFVCVSMYKLDKEAMKTTTNETVLSVYVFIPLCPSQRRKKTTLKKFGHCPLLERARRRVASPGDLCRRGRVTAKTLFGGDRPKRAGEEGG